MSRYLYTDHILEAFNVFHRPMELEEVAGYVAEMEAKSVDEVRLAVDNTLTAAWLHGFLTRDDTMFTLACGYWDDEERKTAHGGGRPKRNPVIRPRPHQSYTGTAAKSIFGYNQDVNYGDQILSAFMVLRPPLTLSDIVEYVAVASNRSPPEIQDAVRDSLDLALAHGFVQKQQDSGGRVFVLASELQESL